MHQQVHELPYTMRRTSRTQLGQPGAGQGSATLRKARPGAVCRPRVGSVSCGTPRNTITTTAAESSLPFADS